MYVIHLNVFNKYLSIEYNNKYLHLITILSSFPLISK